MSPATVGISTTYKTRVALEVIVRNGKKPVLDSEWTGDGGLEILSATTNSGYRQALFGAKAPSIRMLSP